jgi:hypothetical protein
MGVSQADFCEQAVVMEHLVGKEGRKDAEKR